MLWSRAIAPEPYLETTQVTDETYMTPRDVAEKYHVALGSRNPNACEARLAKFRMDGTGPRFIKMQTGARSSVRYRESDILKHLEERTFTNTAEVRAAQK